MLPGIADLNRIRFPIGSAAGQRQLPPLSFIRARRFGAERDRFFTSIPNGGVD
jgi:hypothetical protein